MENVDLDTVMVALLFRNEAIVKCYEHVVVLRHAPAADNCFESNFRWILTSGQYIRRGTCYAILSYTHTHTLWTCSSIIPRKPCKIIPQTNMRSTNSILQNLRDQISQSNEMSHNKFSFPRMPLVYCLHERCCSLLSHTILWRWENISSFL